MILVRLELENFRQYAGEHVIEIPEEATIAVVGRNGAGKTTLFQAIEWCLYGHPPAGELATHGATGQARVALTLRDHEGIDWVVERNAGRRGDRAATVYRAEAPESPLAQGKVAVTEFVARKLVGLGHKAFVSTFFTRQKELAFLSEYPPTQRRREVMKLLGYDAIWTAQADIAERRKTATADAEREGKQFDAAYGERDLPRDVRDASAAVREQETAAASAEQEHAAAVAAHAAAQADLDRWRGLEGRHQGFQLELSRLRGDTAVAMESAGAARNGLQRLDAEAVRRVGIAATAAMEAERAQAVAAWESERRRADEAARVRNDAAKAERGLAALAGQLRSTVVRIDTGHGLPEWTWHDVPVADLPAQAARLLDVIDGIDVTEVCERAEQLRQLLDAQERVKVAVAKAERFRAAREDLRRQRAAKLDGHDPAAEIAAAIAARDEADWRAADAGKALGIASAEIGRLRPLVTRLNDRQVGEHCPTCDRPFTNDDLGETLDYLRGQLASAEADERAGLDLQQTALADRAAALAAEKAARDLQAEADRLEERIASAAHHIAEADNDVRLAEEDLAGRLRRLRLTNVPDKAVIEAETAWADVATALGRARSGIEQARERAEAGLDDLREMRDRLASLADVAYDAAAHDEAVRAHNEARDAVARLLEIDAQLARRPEYENALAGAEARIAGLQGETDRITAEQGALGFDPQALAGAAAAEQATRAEERAADGRLSLARRTVEDARRRHDVLVEDERRMRQWLDRIEALKREANNLSRMYDEFSAFDRHVAGLVKPEIADRTADYLASVTDGHYDKVELTDDFGLRVFDDGEAFSIDTFSGGERDVAALCARLALSSVIAAQAETKRPPSFLVLDEVFGSLDQDRRRLVLETLGRLAGGDGEGASALALRQLFIISHIEDVNESEVVDEAWRVVEERGASRVVRGHGEGALGAL